MLEVEVEDLMVLMQEHQEDKEEEEREDLQQQEQLKMDKEILVVLEVDQDLGKPNQVLVDKVVLV
jgi:hypothetical protein